MAADELDEVVDVWYRSLDGSLGFLGPEQRHPEGEARAFFRDVVAARCELHVAARGMRIVGVLAMLGDEVDRLYVDPGEQRAGVGSALIELAKSISPGGLRLVTLQRNRAARAFYERHGFRAYRYGCSPAPENEPDVWYRWRPEARPENAGH